MSKGRVWNKGKRNAAEDQRQEQVLKKKLSKPASQQLRKHR